MAKSILQTKKECYVTGRTDNLHEHHIFFGTGLRKISEKHGFKCWLTAEYHNMSNKGVHFDRSLDLRIKRNCQIEYEKTHSREDFMKLIGKNYLD